MFIHKGEIAEKTGNGSSQPEWDPLPESTRYRKYKTGSARDVEIRKWKNSTTQQTNRLQTTPAKIINLGK